jgi:hypothetical protein
MFTGYSVSDEYIQNTRLEVEFSLEDEDKLFFNGEDFQKEYDGLTKLILN